MTDLFTRLSNIQKLEKELVKKAATIIRPGTPMYFVDLFAFGATNRTLAQSRGFRAMIETKNFPSAAILLRTQIDTAMRVNGLRYLDTPEAQLREVFEGNKTFRRLVSSQKTAKGRSILMQDVFLRMKLEEDEPWIGKVYEKTSDFVHLSFRPLFSSIQNLDDDDGIVNFAITGKDNAKDESAYYEICDAFFRVSTLTCTSLLGLFIARHASDTLQED
jgi:hypothetical protein